MKLFFALSLLVAIGSLTSCYYDNEEDLYPQNRLCATDSMSYANDILPVLNAQCLSCHSAAAQQGGVDMEGYTSVKKYVDNQKFVRSVKHDAGTSPMPKNSDKLDACTIAKIEAWINQGALNN